MIEGTGTPPLVESRVFTEGRRGQLKRQPTPSVLFPLLRIGGTVLTSRIHGREGDLALETLGSLGLLDEKANQTLLAVELCGPVQPLEDLLTVHCDTPA